MALDTRQKRFSMMNSSWVPMLAIFHPDGAVGAVDRSHLLNLYGGIDFAGIAISFSGTVTNQTFVIGMPVSVDLSSFFSGSETPFNYSINAGTLPDGLVLDPGTGELYGTPTTEEIQEGIIVRATDFQDDTADSNSFKITINPDSVAINFSGPVNDRIAFIGQEFTLNIASYFDGSETPFAFTLQSGTLATGLTLNAGTGVISGIATMEEVHSGIVIRGVDAMTDFADTNAFTITSTSTPPTGNIVDAKFNALRSKGYSGAVPEMTLQWLRANGAAGAESLPDAWRDMLTSKGFSTGNRTDDWFALLGSLGYTGAISDREYAFWIAGGNFA